MSGQHDQQSNNTISIGVGTAVTGAITALVAVVTVIGLAYNQGVQIGKDAAQSECRSAMDDLESTKKKLAEVQSNVDGAVKNLSSWRTAYDSAQKTMADQSAQISALTERVKTANQCLFLREQFSYYQSELNNHNWTADNPRRDELISGRREILARMESCTRL
ncbi:hypothetical protein KTF37_04430 [Burkholderia multivorans]|uniref:hypothetical protein n=1 Tax=Burkholderia multivorans TaxID=87883 RepID=UPI000A8E767F|nr:hypothetical protein [Burkholderia multivorans]MBU9612069.1 hypothetical protein [Burkholderia multivorans]MBU9676087.1 hypothetical protein [Burkholderia multivorans]